MYRAILPDGDIECPNFDRVEQGVELYNEDGIMMAFIPYPNLVALVDEDVTREEERSIM